MKFFMVAICLSMLFGKKKNSFKITAAGIDINQCEYNYFSHVKHTDIVYVLVCR